MNKEISDAFNCIIEFLAVRDIAQMSKDALKQACGASVTDVIIALGSDLPVVAETACELYKAGYGEKLMFCGGIGHSTINLKKKVAKILNVDIDRLPESEAEIYACLAKDKYQIESSSIFMDKTSTNTSENIKNAIQIFNDHTIKHETMILIQDPILQKRSYVTALDLFNNSQKIINYAPIIPKLNPDGTLQNDTPYLWAVSYTHLRAHETDSYLVCRLLLEKKKTKTSQDDSNRCHTRTQATIQLDNSIR